MLTPAQAVQAFCRPVANHFAIEDNPPGIPAGIIRQQADNGLRGGGFPRAGFSDEGQHFAALDGKADVVHHLAPFAPRAVADAQIFNGQKRSWAYSTPLAAKTIGGKDHGDHGEAGEGGQPPGG